MTSAFKSLSPQHQLVVVHYRANGRVQADAWKAAGFADTKSARSTSARWFGTDEAKAAIAELDGEVLSKLKADGDEVLIRLTGIMRGNMADYVTASGETAALDLSKTTRDQWSLVQQIKIGEKGDVTLKLYDARAAAVDLGKFLGPNSGLHMADADADKPIDLHKLAKDVAFVLSAGVQRAESDQPEPLH